MLVCWSQMLCFLDRPVLYKANIGRGNRVLSRKFASTRGRARLRAKRATMPRRLRASQTAQGDVRRRADKKELPLPGLAEGSEAQRRRSSEATIPVPLVRISVC